MYTRYVTCIHTLCHTCIHTTERPETSWMKWCEEVVGYPAPSAFLPSPSTEQPKSGMRSDVNLDLHYRNSRMSLPSITTIPLCPQEGGLRHFVMWPSTTQLVRVRTGTQSHWPRANSSKKSAPQSGSTLKRVGL